MKVINKESSDTCSENKYPRIHIHHFYPSTCFKVASTTKFLLGACPATNVIKDCPTEIKISQVRKRLECCGTVK